MKKQKATRPMALREEGARAYILGREITACPYKPGTEEYDFWVEGWCDKDDEFFEDAY